MRLLSLIFVFSFLACTTPPQPSPPRPDAGDAGLDAPHPAPSPTDAAVDAPAPADAAADGSVGDQADRACHNLAALGCAEGGPHCLSAAEKVVAIGTYAIDLACAEKAKDKASVRACRGIICP